MNQLDNVIQGVRCCFNPAYIGTKCRSCPYFEGHDDCEADLSNDIMTQFSILATLLNSAEPHGADYILELIRKEKERQN